MPVNTAAELLIRIGADPSNAEASIQRFRAQFAKDLGGIGTEIQRWSQRGLGDFNQVRGAVVSLSGAMTQATATMPSMNRQMDLTGQGAQQLASRFRVHMGTITSELERSRQVTQSWRTALVTSFAEVLNTSDALTNTLGRNFRHFDSALGANIANAVTWQRSISEAFRKAALAAIGSIAQEAVVRAIYATALGFYLLAIQDYRGAALAFKSAATYGAVGGAAALAARAISSAEETTATTSESTSTTESEATASTEEERPSTVQIIFQGPVYGGQAGIDELTRAISEAVTERDVNLTAYTVVRQPATRA